MPDPPLGAIVGPGRSGTTWAGTIVDSCPEVIYRFEPFHRMSSVDPAFRNWFERLKNQSVDHSDIGRLYDLLLTADPLINKAPFFPGKAYRVRELGRAQMWPMARMLPPVSRLYRRCYTPRPGPPVIFKEVTFIKPLKALLERIRMPIVYLVRHPCATVLSEVRGLGRERKPLRQRRLRELLQEHAPHLIDRYPSVVAGSDAVSRTALLWRCEVEVCASLVDSSERGLLLTYEQLAGDAYRSSRDMLAHFGLPFSDATQKYLDMLHGVRQGPGSRRRTGWGSRYFSVHRNPRAEKDVWKQRIDEASRRKIEEVVQESPVIEKLASLGSWW